MNRWNLAQDSLTDIAYAIRQRALNSGQRHEVYVRPSGAVVIRLQGTGLRHPINSDWLVGTYDRQATTADIADDLAERAKELAL